MVAGCQDGHGGEGFYRNLADVKDPKDFLDLKRLTPKHLETVPDHRTSQILAYSSASIVVPFVSDLVEPSLTTNMHRILKTFEVLARF